MESRGEPDVYTVQYLVDLVQFALHRALNIQSFPFSLYLSETCCSATSSLFGLQTDITNYLSNIFDTEEGKILMFQKLSPENV